MTYCLSDLMQIVLAERAEAIHLHDGEQPVLERPDLLVAIEGPRLEPADTMIMLRGIAPSGDLEEMAMNGHTLFRHLSKEGVFFRVLAFQEGGSVRLELRSMIQYDHEQNDERDESA